MTALPLNLAVTWGLFSLTALAMLAGVWMWTFRNWLQYRSPRTESSETTNGMPYAGVRIDLADLRERIRRLEAIASGIDIS